MNNHWQVSVSENVILTSDFGVFPFNILYQPFVFLTQKFSIFITRNQLVFGGKILCQFNTNIGVQPPEQPFGKRISKYFFHSFVAFVARSQTIAMPDKKLGSVDSKLLRKMKNSYDLYFLKIIGHPQIVIAYEEIYWRSIVFHLS